MRPVDRLRGDSTDAQDFTALTDLGVPGERGYADHGLTGAHRDRPGLREAFAACRAGDTIVVTKLDRLTRSLPDARDIVEDLTCRQVKLNLGGRCMTRSCPTAGVQRARAGRRVRSRSVSRAHARGDEKSPTPTCGATAKLTPRQEAHLAAQHRTGEHTAELGELFNVARSTVYRGA